MERILNQKWKTCRDDQVMRLAMFDAPRSDGRVRTCFVLRSRFMP